MVVLRGLKPYWLEAGEVVGAEEDTVHSSEGMEREFTWWLMRVPWLTEGHGDEV